MLCLSSEKAVPLEQQYSNNWITWDNSPCEGCGEATSQGEKALDHWTLGNLITSLLNAKGQKRQLCRILNATKNKNNVLLHCGKKTRNLLYTAYGSLPQSMKQEEFKQVAQLCETETGSLRKLKPTWFLNRQRQFFKTTWLRMTVKAKTVYQKLINRKENLKMSGTILGIHSSCAVTLPLFFSVSQQHYKFSGCTEMRNPIKLQAQSFPFQMRPG